MASAPNRFGRIKWHEVIFLSAGDRRFITNPAVAGQSGGAADDAMPTRKTIDEKLSALDALAAEGDPSTQLARIQDTLDDWHYRVVAKATRLAADGLFYEAVPNLMAAYPRFLEQPGKRDSNCLAKKAIVRALVDLECNDTAFFLAGLRYRQQEPVWGGVIDTAVEVRCSCAMGLVATGYARALVELTALFHDPEAEARAGDCLWQSARSRVVAAVQSLCR